MLSKKLIFIFIALLAVVGCGGKKTQSGVVTNTTVSTYFVMGDPESVIDGSTKNKDSFLVTNNLSSFDDYALTAIWQFAQKDAIVNQANMESAEEGNEATEVDRTKEQLHYYKFKKTNSSYTYSSEASPVSLNFIDKNGALDIKSITISGKNYDVSAIHYSLKKNNDAFSILVGLETQDDGKIIVSFVFTKKSTPKDITIVDSKYKYLYGPGVVVGWPQDKILQVDICGKQSKVIEESYKNGISQWNDALKGRLKVRTNVLTTYPPFSDLNNNCIYTVNNYLRINDDYHVNSAITVYDVDSNKGELINSDILFWVKENEKYGSDFGTYPDMIQHTTAHEFGHLLGLDHQFDENYVSIMSYDNVADLMNYDYKAIFNLYPEL